MRRAFAALAALPLVLVAGPAGPARAVDPLADNVVTAAATRYVPAQVTIKAGQTLELVNLENSPHDVVAYDWSGGLPLFQSPVVGVGGRARVARVESLPPSVYLFVCSVHDTMTGLLTVQAP
jgi:plastocyanin